LSEDLNKIGLGYIWEDPKENSASRICKRIKERCNNIQRQNLFANTRENMALIFYCEMKLEWLGKKTQPVVQGTRDMGWLGLRLVFGN
jgi:hypothetical protein